MALFRWLLASLLGCASMVQAQDYPTKPIRILTPYLPGNSLDLASRILGNLMGPMLGQSFVVENRPGAGGLTAMQEVLRATDGYTVICADVSHWAVLPAVRPGAYDPLRDFAPIGLVARSRVEVIAWHTLPVKDFRDFVALAKSKPGALSYGTPGQGTVLHLFMETLKSEYGFDVVHIPYKGGSQLFAAFVAGQVPIIVGGGTQISVLEKEGKIHRLLVGSRERSPLAQNVPSTSDIGRPDIDFNADIGFLTAAAAPRVAIERLSAALGKAVQSPEYIEKLTAVGTQAIYRSPDQFAELIRNDIVKYARAVKIANVKLE